VANTWYRARKGWMLRKGSSEISTTLSKTMNPIRPGEVSSCGRSFTFLYNYRLGLHYSPLRIRYQSALRILVHSVREIVRLLRFVAAIASLGISIESVIRFVIHFIWSENHNRPRNNTFRFFRIQQLVQVLKPLHKKTSMKKKQTSLLWIDRKRRVSHVG
jgi:hypothetical protein